MSYVGNEPLEIIQLPDDVEVRNDLVFLNSGNRITGDFSNATAASRVMFQSNVTNGGSYVGIIPNGTSLLSQVNLYNGADPSNASGLGLYITGTEAIVTTTKYGTGTYLPMTFYTSASEKFRIGAEPTGTFTFSGTAPRITGDFSNATAASRVMFQSSTTDGATELTAIPNGTSTTSRITALNNSTPTSATGAQIAALSTEARISAMSYGPAYLPMTFYTGGAERMQIDIAGKVTCSSPAGGLGYGSGAGGQVTQLNSKADPVTLNNPTGQITMHNASLAADTTVSFTFNNSLVGPTDTFSFAISNAVVDPSKYNIQAFPDNGSAIIFVRNISAAPLAEGFVLNFNLHKGSNS